MLTNIQLSRIVTFTFSATLGLVTIFIIPFFFFFNGHDLKYELFKHGQRTEATVLKRGPIETDGLLPYPDFNKFKTSTLAYNAEDGTAHTLTTKMYKLPDSMEFNRPLPFNLSITYNKNQPDMSELTRYVPESLIQLLLSWSHWIVLEIAAIWLASFILLKAVEVDRDDYPLF